MHVSDLVYNAVSSKAGDKLSWGGNGEISMYVHLPVFFTLFQQMGA